MTAIIKTILASVVFVSMCGICALASTTSDTDSGGTLASGRPTPSFEPKTETPTSEPTQTTAPTSTPSIELTPVLRMVLNDANLRAGPGTDFSILGGMSAGDYLTLVGCDRKCDWYELSNGAWIAGFLLDEPPRMRSTYVSRPTRVPTNPAVKTRPKPTLRPTATPRAVKFRQIAANVWTGVDVYYGAGTTKTYGFEILGGSKQCRMMPSGKGLFVMYPDGTREWKDRGYILWSGNYFVRDDDPALDEWEWHIYRGCP